MKLQSPKSGEYIIAECFAQSMRRMRTGASMGEMTPLFEQHPGSALYGDWPVAFYESSSNDEGRCQLLMPPALVTNYDYGDTHRFFAINQECYAYKQPLADEGAGTVWSNGNKNWINSTGDYVVEIYVDDVKQTSGYTIDYPKGQVTFSTTQAGSEVTWIGYWLDETIVYSKDMATDAVRSYTPYVNTFNTAFYTVPVLNGRFDHWTSSTQPAEWTKAGTVAQTASLLGNNSGYAARLTAVAGVSSIKQTLASPVSNTVYTAIAVAKCTNKMKLRISTDGESTWSTCLLTVDSQSINKWIFLGVQSTANSTAAPVVQFLPQDTGSDTGTADVEYIGVFAGGLQ